MVLEKTLESPLNCKEIQPVHPKGTRKFETSHVGGATGRTPPIPRLCWDSQGGLRPSGFRHQRTPDPGLTLPPHTHFLLQTALGGNSQHQTHPITQGNRDLNSQRLPEKLPEVTGTSRGNPEFPEVTRERLGPRQRPRESFFNASRGPSPLP